MNRYVKEKREALLEFLPWYMWTALALVVVTITVAIGSVFTNDPSATKTALMDAGCTRQAASKLTDAQASSVMKTMREVGISGIGRERASAPIDEYLVVNKWGDGKPFVIGGVVWIEPETCSVKAGYSQRPPGPKEAKTVAAEWLKDFFVYQSDVNAAIHDTHDMKARGIAPFPCTTYHAPTFTKEVINKKVVVGPTNSDLQARQYYSLSIRFDCIEPLPTVDRSVQRA